MRIMCHLDFGHFPGEGVLSSWHLRTGVLAHTRTHTAPFPSGHIFVPCRRSDRASSVRSTTPAMVASYHLEAAQDSLLCDVYFLVTTSFASCHSSCCFRRKCSGMGQDSQLASGQKSAIPPWLLLLSLQRSLPSQEP